MANLVALIGLLVVALVCGGKRQSRLAIAYFGLVYMSTALPFSFDVDLQIPFGTYVAILSTCSFVQIALYLSLDLTAWIIGAALCELALMALCLGAGLRIEAILHLRLALLESVNLIAMACLAGNWLNGKFADNRPIRARLWSFDPDRLAVRSWGLHARAEDKGLVQGFEGKMS